jgi:hypothetical protein
VWEVVKPMNGVKAPGPNGYSMAFFQACWVVLKEDIIKSFVNFMLVVSLREALMLRSLPLFRRFQVLSTQRIFT